MPVDCLCHTEDNRELSWRIFLGDQQSDSVVATAWLKRQQRCKGTINGDIQLRFFLLHAYLHLCVFLCLWQHILIHWWAGDRMSQSMRSKNQLISKLLVGVIPTVWQQDGCGEVSHHPDCLQGKTSGRDRGSDSGNGVRALQSWDSGFSTRDTTVNKWQWLIRQWFVCPLVHARSAHSHQQRVESLKCF